MKWSTLSTHEGNCRISLAHDRWPYVRLCDEPVKFFINVETLAERDLIEDKTGFTLYTGVTPICGEHARIIDEEVLNNSENWPCKQEGCDRLVRDNRNDFSIQPDYCVEHDTDEHGGVRQPPVSSD